MEAQERKQGASEAAHKSLQNTLLKLPSLMMEALEKTDKTR